MDSIFKWWFFKLILFIQTYAKADKAVISAVFIKSDLSPANRAIVFYFFTGRLNRQFQMIAAGNTGTLMAGYYFNMSAFSGCDCDGLHLFPILHSSIKPGAIKQIVGGGTGCRRYIIIGYNVQRTFSGLHIITGRFTQRNAGFDLSFNKTHFFDINPFDKDGFH